MDPGTLAIIMIFGMPVFIVGITKYFGYKRERLRLKSAERAPEEARRLQALEQERAQLAERVEHLETIVCSVDLELNARLNRLAAQQSHLALPAPVREPTPATAESASGAAPDAPAPDVPAPNAAPAARGDPSREVTLMYEATTGELPVGSTLLERFLVDKTLGRGGMGAVYLATDRQLGEQVALKVIANNLAGDPAAVERFRREASAARKITHGNVIRIYDMGSDGGLLFLSMEYFPGLTLAEVLRRRHLLPVDEARAILAQVCDALTAAHGAGVIHRDLKPQNVLVNERREVKVIDFGLAKATYLEGMTATGLILGTPEYMAPEQVRGGPTDLRTDLYAVGAVAYHMLCGRPPFVADSAIAVGFAHCNDTPRPPRELKPELPEAVEAAILRCLDKSPARRFDSAAELKLALS